MKWAQAAMVPALFICAALIVVLCPLRTKQRLQAQSSAMMPTIMPGDILVLDRKAYAAAEARRWDLLAFRPLEQPREITLMRIVGLPGETVTFAPAGGILINGRLEAPPHHLRYVKYRPMERMVWPLPQQFQLPYTLGSDQYFVLGDNVRNAYDSRFWGPVSRSNIVGRIIGIN